MAVHKDIEPDLDITDVELKTLKEEWASGELNTLSGHLLEFVDRHRADILKIARNAKSPEKLVEATRKFVRRRGYIHLPLDMADQIHEINNEIWYKGEEGDFNRQKIKESWTQNHAPNWRKWRVKQILFIIDQRASEVAAELAR
jgi:hypothetical protein